MDEIIENDEAVSVGQAIHEIRDMMRDLSTYIQELRAEREKILQGVVLSREQVMSLLNVSKSTLARWRQDGVIPYKVLKNNTSVYLYDELYTALRRGDFAARGFNRTAAIQRMKEYMTGRIEGDVLTNDYLQ